MAHHTSRQGYHDLLDRLNLAAQGAVASPLLEQIFTLLLRPEDATRLAALPLRPFSARRAAGIWRVTEAEAQRRLDELAERALLVDVQHGATRHYVLPPPMIGFFEFALMRVRPDLNQHLLAELFEQYVTSEDDFMRALVIGGPTQQGRILVCEDAVGLGQHLEVLDYERASTIVAQADAIAVGLCYCRHKRAHLGRACSAPQELCLSLNFAAATLARHHSACAIGRDEALAILERARAADLIHFADNVQEQVNFICNCCPCCCEALTAARRFGLQRPLMTSNFTVRADQRCSGCGRCLPACPIRVLTLASELPDGRGRKRAVVDETLCLGCGRCTRHCPRGALTLERRTRRVLTPVNTTHRHVVMALERGKLQNLIFDNHTLCSHRALAALCGVVLRLPPLKRLLAVEQLGSRYLAALCRRYERHYHP